MSKLLELFFYGFVKLKRFLASHTQLQSAYQRVLNRVDSVTSFSKFDIHERMLADTVRTDAYYHAISKYVRNGDVVIDLGTGTGILSFFAHKKHPKRIYAIDHSTIIDRAQLIAESNHMDNIIFMKGYSKDISLPEKADVLIQEQMGSALFDENMVECVLDLRNRLLKKGGRILPNKFDFLVEPIQIKDEWRVPFIWEQHIRDIDFSGFKKQNEGMKNVIKMIRPYEFELFLSDPAPLFSFDLETMPNITSIPNRVHSKKNIASAGRLDGFCVYFRAWFDGSLVLDTSPLRKNRSFSNWAIPFFRVESVLLKEGSEIDFTLQMSDLKDSKSWSLTYNI
jgi:ubiquinone/menaquinone biosynthesis C-methylase UbiE